MNCLQPLPCHQDFHYFRELTVAVEEQRQVAEDGVGNLQLPKTACDPVQRLLHLTISLEVHAPLKKRPANVFLHALFVGNHYHASKSWGRHSCLPSFEEWQTGM